MVVSGLDSAEEDRFRCSHKSPRESSWVAGGGWMGCVSGRRNDLEGWNLERIGFGAIMNSIEFESWTSNIGFRHVHPGANTAGIAKRCANRTRVLEIHWNSGCHHGVCSGRIFLG